MDEPNSRFYSYSIFQLLKIFQEIMDTGLSFEIGILRCLKERQVFSMANCIPRFHPIKGAKGFHTEAVLCNGGPERASVIGIPSAFVVDISLQKSVFPGHIGSPARLVIDAQSKRAVFAKGVYPDILVVFSQMKPMILWGTSRPEGKNAAWGCFISRGCILG